jgi:DNA-binding NarL/FixJ family response regulator
VRGSSAISDRAVSALTDAGIEVTSIEPGGKGAAPIPADTELDVLVTSDPGRGDAWAAALERLCSSGDFTVVVVTSELERDATLAMLRAGVRGIVLHEELEQALAPTVRAARAGQVAIPRAARRQIFRPVLSHRENTVLAMVAMGRSNAQIAASLHVEESTVKSHLGSLFAKLGVRSREDAAAVVHDGESQIASGVLAVTDQQQ